MAGNPDEVGVEVGALVEEFRHLGRSRPPKLGPTAEDYSAIVGGGVAIVQRLQIREMLCSSFKRTVQLLQRAAPGKRT